MAMHDGQLLVGVDTVRRLDGAQFDEWADLPVQRVESAATVNAVFRIGDELTARFPLQGRDPAQARDRLEAEAAAARELAGASTVPTPEPVALGEPGHGYPLPWSVQTWVAGRDATAHDPADSDAFAGDLAALVAGLRSADTRGRTFDGEGRGGAPPRPRRVDGGLLRPEQGPARRGAAAVDGGAAAYGAAG